MRQRIGRDLMYAAVIVVILLIVRWIAGAYYGK